MIRSGYRPLNENRKHDERYRNAYAACMHSRGYTAKGGRAGLTHCLRHWTQVQYPDGRASTRATGLNDWSRVDLVQIRRLM